MKMNRTLLICLILACLMCSVQLHNDFTNYHTHPRYHRPVHHKAARAYGCSPNPCGAGDTCRGHGPRFYCRTRQNEANPCYYTRCPWGRTCRLLGRGTYRCI